MIVAMQRWILAITAVVAMGVFLNTLGNDFTFDDHGALEMAHKLAAGESSEWGRALTYGTHLLDLRLWGDWLPGHHLTNLLLYGTATALATLAALWLAGSWPVALFTGLLFAVHPVHVEAVASIAFRKDVLAMCFAMAALLLWMRVGHVPGKDGSAPASDRRAPRSHGRASRTDVQTPTGVQTSHSRWGSQVLSLVCLVLGLISKEVAVIGVVPFLFLVDRFHRGLSTGQALRRIAPLLLLAIVAVGFFSRTLHTPVAGNSVWNRFTAPSIVKITEGQVDSYAGVLGTAACANLDVLRLLVWPARLSADYNARVQASPWTRCALAGVLLCIASVGAALWLLRRGHRRAFLAISWFLLLYLPVSNVLPLTHFFVADRYLMVPSFGFCLLVGLAFEAWIERARRHALTRYVPQTLLAVLVAAGAARSFWRNRDWRNEETLWMAALRAGSDTYRAHYNLGNVFAAQNEPAAATAQFEAALRLDPEAPWARRNLVQALFDQGYYADAEAHLRVLLRGDPEDTKVWRSLAQVLVRQRKFEEALEASRQVLRREPQSVDALYVQSLSLERLGRRDEALASYGQTLEAIAAATARGEETQVPPGRVRERLEALRQGDSGAHKNE